MRCTGVTYFLPYRQIRLEIKRGTLAELRLADQSNDYSASADDEEYEEDETDDAFFLSAAGKACHDRVRVSLLPAIPDLSNHYTAQLKHWIVRSDQITVGVNERGLLHSLPDSEDTESEPDDADEPEEMILEYYPVSGADCATAQFEAIFDPRRVGDIKLPGQFSQYQFSLFGAAGAEALTDSAIASREIVEGLVYRRSLPYVLTMDVCEPGPCFARKAVRFMLPNEGPTAVLPYRASALVDTKYIARFRDGELIG